MSVLPQLLFTFMGGDLSKFAFSSAGHFGSPCLTGNRCRGSLSWNKMAA
jgi:hypothetical protein